MSFKDNGVAGFDEHNNDWFNFHHGGKDFECYIDGAISELKVTGWNRETKSVFIHVMGADGELFKAVLNGEYAVYQAEIKVDNFDAYANDELIESWGDL